MYRTESEFSNTDVGIARNVDPGARSRIRRTVTADHQGVVKAGGIGRRRRNGSSHRPKGIAATGTNQSEKEKPSYTAHYRLNHQHPNLGNRSIHIALEGIFHSNGWRRYAPEKRLQSDTYFEDQLRDWMR